MPRAAGRESERAEFTPPLRSRSICTISSDESVLKALTMLELIGSVVVAVPADYTRYYEPIVHHLGVAARVVKQVVFRGPKTVVKSAAAEHIRHLGWHGHRRQAGRARPPFPIRPRS